MTQIVTVDYIDAHGSLERDTIRLDDEIHADLPINEGGVLSIKTGFRALTYAPGKWVRVEHRRVDTPPDLDEQAEDLAKVLWRSTQTHYTLIDSMMLSWDEAAKSDREHYRELARTSIEHLGSS